jgi:hypothetical protein
MGIGFCRSLRQQVSRQMLTTRVLMIPAWMAAMLIVLRIDDGGRFLYVSLLIGSVDMGNSAAGGVYV